MLVLLLTCSVHAQDPAEYFKQNCVSCHTIGGGRLTGPDLQNVSERQDAEWLVRFISNPKAMIDSGDPYALELLDQSRGVVMPTPQNITPAFARELVALIQEESAKEESQFRGLQISDAPFTAMDIARGKAVFEGRVKLTNGGPACVSCHNTAGLGGLEGGRLGPDLTLVFERLEGRKGLAAWLLNPATVTMQSVFSEQPLQQDEILPLVAYFEDRSKKSAIAPANTASFRFFLLGLFGVIVALALFDILWKKRLRSVRRTQVLDAANEVLHGR
ncbi:cytochrome c [bacterium]|nr:cytochrome c [bacterium]